MRPMPLWPERPAPADGRAGRRRPSSADVRHPPTRWARIPGRGLSALRHARRAARQPSLPSSVQPLTIRDPRSRQAVFLGVGALAAAVAALLVSRKFSAEATGDAFSGVNWPVVVAVAAADVVATL